jgi:hypothetical protein
MIPGHAIEKVYYVQPINQIHNAIQNYNTQSTDFFIRTIEWVPHTPETEYILITFLFMVNLRIQWSEFTQRRIAERHSRRSLRNGDFITASEVYSLATAHFTYLFQFLQISEVYDVEIISVVNGVQKVKIHANEHKVFFHLFCATSNFAAGVPGNNAPWNKCPGNNILCCNDLNQRSLVSIAMHLDPSKNSTGCHRGNFKSVWNVGNPNKARCNHPFQHDYVKKRFLSFSRNPYGSLFAALV